VDTREKIVSFESLPAVLAEAEWIAAAGLFDPLTAVQAKRLAALANNGGHSRKLLAIVLKDEGALLPAQARAILIAALREVSAVVIAEPDCWRQEVSKNSRLRIVEDSEGEKLRSAEFAQFIIQRQGSAANIQKRNGA
jgi:hypothetical protein